MPDKPFIYIDYVCDKCSAEICATDFFIGQLKLCRHCGHAMVVPPSSTQHRSEGGSKRHTHEKPPALRDERYYASVLQLPTNVTRDNIKTAYREQLMKYHPDRVQHLGREFQEMAEEKTKLITEAYTFFCKRYGI